MAAERDRESMSQPLRQTISAVPNLSPGGIATVARDIPRAPNTVSQDAGYAATHAHGSYSEQGPATEGGWQPRVEPQVSALVLEILGAVLEQPGLHRTAQALVGQLQVVCACERVSLGVLRGRLPSRDPHTDLGAAELEAISGAVDVVSMSQTLEHNGQQALVRAIGTAMGEAIDQRAVLLWPTPAQTPGVMRPWHGTLAHRTLGQLTGAATLLTLPLVEDGLIIGAVVLESRTPMPEPLRLLAESAVSFAAPVIGARLREDQPLSGRWVDAAARVFSLQAGRQAGRRGLPLVQRFSFGKALLGLLAVGSVAMLAIPVTFTVGAPARVEGVVQRVVAAPFDGFLKEAKVRPGERVKAGQVLAELEDRELELQMRRLEAEYSQMEKAYRDALAKEDSGGIVVAQQKMRQVSAQYDLATDQKTRAVLTAPFDGVVIEGDLTQQLGAPVKRGEKLMTVAPEGKHRIIVEVDETDIDFVKKGQTAHVRFANAAVDDLTIKVGRIAPLAALTQGDAPRNAFDVEAVAEGVQGQGELRPGLRGWAKLDAGDRALAWVLTQRAMVAIRLAWFRWVG